VLILKEIAKVESCYKQKFGTPRQPGLVPESFATIYLKKEFQPELSLQGLEKFSHIWLIWGFHQNSNAGFHAKVHPPRLKGKRVGVFATRSPHRPNPIGLSLVAIEKIVLPNKIHIKGVDLVDGTPIYDIKPYLPEIESIPSAKSNWLPEEVTSEFKPFKIHWSDLAINQLKIWEIKEANGNLQKLVEDSLILDPRPLAYKKKDEDNKLIRQKHAMRIGQADIHFRYVNELEILIDEVKL
jgi:tRNA-Thr(GGU) m(6)t(6)A37 methyltransferase TsaA